VLVRRVVVKGAVEVFADVLAGLDDKFLSDVKDEGE
jgi:hypothetical protein